MSQSNCNPCWSTIITIGPYVSSSSQTSIPGSSAIQPVGSSALGSSGQASVPGSSAIPSIASSQQPQGSSGVKGSSAGSSRQGSFSSAPPGGIARIALGTAETTGSNTVTIIGVSCNAGDLLLVAVGIANNVSFAGTVDFSGTNVPVGAVANSTACSTHISVRLFSLKITVTNPTGVITFTGGDATQSDYLGLVMMAVKVTGLASDAVDAQTGATGTTTSTPSSGAATTTHANEFWWGASLQWSASGITVGTWSNSWNDGQTVALTISGGFLLIDEGYKIVSATGSANAAKTGCTQSCVAVVMNTYF